MPLEIDTDDVSSERAHAERSQRVANVESQFDATGFAQIIGELADNAASADFVNVAAPRRHGTVSALNRTTARMRDLEKYFVLPPEAQDAALARHRLESAAHPGRSGIGTRRGLRATVRGRAVSASGRQLPQRDASAEAVVPKVRVYPNLGVMLGTVNRQGLEDVRADPRVADVQGAPAISLIRPTNTTSSRRAKGISWGLERLGVPEMWKAGFTGKGVLVGHLDTGVDGAHAALKGAIRTYAEFDSVGMPISGARPRDSGEHGTHTAGTIAARAVGTTRFGVAPEAQLASAMVIEGGNVIARILAGMDWTVGQGVQILSMSLGLRGYTPAFLMLSRLLRSRGILPVFAVGNEGPGTSRSPGNYVEVLSVGACDARDTVADFSGSQLFARTGDPIAPDLVAPGVDVLSCVPGGRYAAMSGSSMATPHIAGLAALLMQASKASANAVEKAILDSCRLAPGMLPDRASRGLPNGPRAYELLTGKPLVAEKTIKNPIAKKPRRKKAPTKKLVTTKPGAKKRAGRKSTPKEPVAKKPVAKKPASKKTTARKPVARNSARKRAAKST